MARIKFRFKRQRLSLDEYDFNFGSDEEEVTTTVKVEEKVAIAGTKAAGKRKRKTQNQWNMPESNANAECGRKPWESWLGKVESPQRRSPSPVTKSWGSWLGKVESPQRRSPSPVTKSWGSWLGKMESSPRRSPSPVARLTSSVTEKSEVPRGLSTLSSSNIPKCARHIKSVDKPRTRAGKDAVVDRPKLVVMRGDPTDWHTEAIVSDANSLLHPNCGLAATIVNKGGLDILYECRQWIYSRGEVPVGSAMWTTAGKLSSTIVIHTVGPDVSSYRHPTLRHQQELRDAVRSALSIANDLSMTSVAIPALCTGVSHYPKYLAAREIVAECLEFCDDYPFTELRLIVFMNEDQLATSAFVQAMKDVREQRQEEQQWTSAVEMPNGLQRFGSVFDSSSDESSETLEK